MENLPASFIPKSGRKYSHTNSEIFFTTLISEADHLTAGAWAACDRMENSRIRPVQARKDLDSSG